MLRRILRWKSELSRRNGGEMRGLRKIISLSDRDSQDQSPQQNGKTQLNPAENQL